MTPQALDKRNMFTTAEVDEWLGLQESDDMQNTANEVVSAIKADPKCRLIFFWGPDDQAHLNVTKDIVTKILTYHQVMPVYIDFMSVFGECTQERDLRFSGFREQNFMAENRSGLSIPGLRRSGKQFQLCYNLKCVSLHVENKEELGKNEWRVRQAAVHHQFDVLEGTTLWVVTMGSLELQKRSKELTLRDQTQEEGDISSFDTSAKCFSASLETHLVYCHWATEDWRGYIRWMESMIEKEVCCILPHAPNFFPGCHLSDLSPPCRLCWLCMGPVVIAMLLSFMVRGVFRAHTGDKTRSTSLSWS